MAVNDNDSFCSRYALTFCVTICRAVGSTVAFQRLLSRKHAVSCTHAIPSSHCRRFPVALWQHDPDDVSVVERLKLSSCEQGRVDLVKRVVDSRSVALGQQPAEATPS